MKQWILVGLLAMLAVPMSSAAGLPDFDTDLKAFRAKMSKMEVPPVPEEAQLPRSVNAFGRYPEKTLRTIIHRLAERAALGNIEARIFIDRNNDYAQFDCLTHTLWPIQGPNPAASQAAHCRDGYYIIAGRILFKDAHSADELSFVIAHELAHIADRDYRGQLRALQKLCGVSLMGPDGEQVGQRCLDAPKISARFDAFCRKQEDAADANALDLVRLAGFDPSVAKGFFIHDKVRMGVMGHKESKGRHDRLLDRALKLDGYNRDWPGDPK